LNSSGSVEVHIQEKSAKETTVEFLKWLHIAITNSKRWILGILHNEKSKYLQNCPNAFCYKLNRTYFSTRFFIGQ